MYTTAAGSREGVGDGRAWRGEPKAGAEASGLWLTTALLYHRASSRDDQGNQIRSWTEKGKSCMLSLTCGTKKIKSVS